MDIEIKTVSRNQDRKQIKYIGSDCFYCSLEEGINCMMYFCKKSAESTAFSRRVCTDGFMGECPDYKKQVRV